MEIRKDIITRFGIIYFSIAILGLVIIIGILKVQNLDTTQWEKKSKEIKSDTKEVQAIRGNICADDGSILATSIPYYEIRLDLKAPQVLKTFDANADLLGTEVAELFGCQKSLFMSRLKEAFAKGNRGFLLDKKKLNYDELQQLKNFPTMKRSIFGSGLKADMENVRILPHGDLASRTIGTLNKGVFGGIHGNVGYTGVEGMAESFLAGERGISIKKNFSGTWLDIPISEPVDGEDVITTINVNLQDFAQNALMSQMETSQAEWGTAVVMEVKTGDIKAIANVGHRKDGTYGESYNYAFGHAGCCEPGSTFKLVSLMVAIDHGYIDTCDVVDTGNGIWEIAGQKIKDSHGGEGRISVQKVLEVSSNVGTAKVINQCFSGREREFVDRIYKFGLNKPLGLGMMGEGVPFIKYPTDASWWPGSLAFMSHGYELKVTPLHTLTFYNAVANDGKMVKPRFVDEIRDNGVVVRKFKTEVMNPAICSRETIGKAQGMLKAVCSKGTGKSLKNPYYTIAGKTGTAVIANEDAGYVAGGKKKYQASFVGYFPADNPQYSCIVVIVGPQGLYYGASVAGPVFKEIADKVYASFIVPKDSVVKRPIELPFIKPGFGEEVALETTDLGILADKPGTELVSAVPEEKKIRVSPLETQKGVVPDVTGMGAGDALFLLENAGLKVRMTGMGRVTKQSLDPGLPVAGGESVDLVLDVYSEEMLTDSLPDLVGKNNEAAMKELKKLGLKVKKTGAEKGVVKRQSIDAGKRVGKGETIEIEIG